MSNDKTTHEVNESDIPTLEPSHRANVKKFAAIGIATAGAILLIDDAIKRFKDRKSVTLSIEDKSDSDD